VRAAGGALATALRQADENPVELVGTAARYGSRFARFIGLAYHLQRHREGQPIYLPVKAVGALLGAHYTTAADWRRLACDVGLLVVVDPTFEPFPKKGAKARAATHRFNFTSPLYRDPEAAKHETAVNDREVVISAADVLALFGSSTPVECRSCGGTSWTRVSGGDICNACHPRGTDASSPGGPQ
jgi:hypothetical protein